VRGPGSSSHVLKIAVGLLFGALGGLLGTAGMYGVAALELAVAGVPFGSWMSATEVGFGGAVGSVFGLTGVPLHVVHGFAIGALVGATLFRLRPRISPLGGTWVGALAGVVLWTGVLALSPSARTLQGNGPPLALSFVMHVAFGVATGVTVAVGARWWGRRKTAG